MGRRKRKRGEDLKEEEEPEVKEEGSEKAGLDGVVPVGKPVRISGKGKTRRSHYDAFEYNGNRYGLKDGCSSDYKSYLEAKGDADIFFPTDFWLLERIDHYCSGWQKLLGDKSSKQGKKRRTLVLDTSFMEEFGLASKT